MNDSAYYNLCAFFLFAGLEISIQNLKIKTCKYNKMLIRSLNCGTMCVLLGFFCNFASSVFPHNQFFIVLLYIIKYCSILTQILMIQFNSFYFFNFLGLSGFIRKNRFLNVLGRVLFIAPIGIVLSNIIFKNLFFITNSLNIGISPHFLIYFLSLSLILLKDGIVLLVYQKYLTNKKALFTLIFFVFNIFFILFEYFNPGLKLSMIVFAASVYVEISFVRHPDLQESPLTGALSRQAFFTRCQAVFLQKRESMVLFIKIRNYKSLKLYVGQNVWLDCLRYISGNLKELCSQASVDSDVYYLGHGVYSVVIESKIFTKKNKIVDKISRLIEVMNIKMQESFQINNFTLSCDAICCAAVVPSDIQNMDFMREFSTAFDQIVPEDTKLSYYKDIALSADFIVKKNLKEIMERAIKNDYLEVYYQPIFSAKDKAFKSAEALVRINDPEYGLIMPSVFLPYAEQKEYIHEIDNFVLNSVFKFVAGENFKKSGLRYVELNLSASQCAENNFAEKVMSLLQKYNISTEEIRFEIQETSADLNTEIIKERLNHMHEQGFKFILDGYGTGYSNIKSLRKMPFEVVKLDRSFVSKSDNPQIFNILQSTIKMFNQLDKQILIEGIENKETESMFLNASAPFCSCDYLQGFYYSDALNENEFFKFLNNE